MFKSIRLLPSAYLEAGLGVVPVCPHDEGLLWEELGDVDGVLLRALVLVVVVHRPREEDLRVVVDVAAHVERALLRAKEKFTDYVRFDDTS